MENTKFHQSATEFCVWKVNLVLNNTIQNNHIKALASWENEEKMSLKKEEFKILLLVPIIQQVNSLHWLLLKLSWKSADSHLLHHRFECIWQREKLRVTKNFNWFFENENSKSTENLCVKNNKTHAKRNCVCIEFDNKLLIHSRNNGK